MFRPPVNSSISSSNWWFFSTFLHICPFWVIIWLKKIFLSVYSISEFPSRIVFSNYSFLSGYSLSLTFSFFVARSGFRKCTMSLANLRCVSNKASVLIPRWFQSSPLQTGSRTSENSFEDNGSPRLTSYFILNWVIFVSSWMFDILWLYMFFY